MGTIADVSSRDALDVAVADVVDRFGRVDVVIANAGILSRRNIARHADVVDRVRARGQRLGRHQHHPGGHGSNDLADRGQFVLISSVFAFNGMGTIPDAMSKAAVEQLGRGLRVELAAHGVSTTVADLLTIETNMIRQGVDDDPSSTSCS